MIRDYTYVDHRRLDAYVEGIRSARKNLLWKFGIGPSGPTVEAAQDSSAVDIRLNKKVETLLQYVKKNALLDNGRISDDLLRHANPDRVFRLETCDVVTVSIPANERRSPPFRAMNMWISERTERNEQHLLVLLADFAKDDETIMYDRSSYSALLALVDEGYDLRKAFEDAGIGPFAELRRQVELAEGDMARELEGFIIKRFHSPGDAPLWPNLDDRLGALEAESRKIEQKLRQQFSSNLIGLLSSLGATIGGRRKVEVLYRVRATMNDEVHPETVITIAYPIVMWSAGYAIS